MISEKRLRKFKERMEGAARAAIGSPIKVRLNNRRARLSGILVACEVDILQPTPQTARAAFRCVVEAGTARLRHSFTLASIPGVR